MTSRSRFYVDTPRDPSQRHSMFVSHSELTQRQDLSSNSSSATLPSTAGSVDRLTGLEEKKSSRFFTLKPKTSFSLRPFFRSSSSLASPSPGKRRKAVPLERRDSYVQTEESRPEFGEVGVQTLNASTVDVPVQTCSEAWEEGDSYGQKRYTYARASPFSSRPYVTSSGLSNSLTVKNVSKDPLASPKLIKYAAPGDSTKQTALFLPSAVSPLNVNSCQPVSPPSQSLSPDSTNVPVKNIAAKKLTGNTISLAANSQSDKNTLNALPSESYDNVCPRVNSQLDLKNSGNNLGKSGTSVPESENSNLKDIVKDLCKSETSIAESENSLDNISQVSYDLKFCDPLNFEHPISVLKTERTDSPSRRFKSVHFDLPSSESPPNSAVDSNKPRNVDKDFEALLRDLNVWTDDASDLQINFSNSPHEKCPTPTLLSPSLKSAFDVLKQDFLSPIPEIANEFNENEENADLKESALDSLDKNIKKRTDTEITKTNENSSVTNREIKVVSANSDAVKPKRPLIRSISEYENTNTVEINRNDTDTVNTDNNNLKTNIETEIVSANSDVAEFKQPLNRSISEYENQSAVKVNKNDFAKRTSEAIFTSSNSVPNAETDSFEGNVYDNVIKENIPVKTAPLPTLPFFFESGSSPPVLQTAEITENVNENYPECPPGTDTEPKMPFGTDFERNRFSRSSSRSSVRSNSKIGVDAINEPVNRFDSCENLDQLEEEIIRSLYSPVDGKLEDNIMNNIDLPPSESFQNSGTTATHMRRVILDQLLSGKNVEDIVPNCPKYQRSQSVPESLSPHANKYKPPQKYTAILTKIENDGFESSSTKYFAPENGLTTAINSCTTPNMNSLDQKSGNVSETKHSIVPNTDLPKKTYVFLFPEDRSNSEMLQKSSLEISTSPLLNSGSSILEVRRSSWTPHTTADSASSSSAVNSSVGKEKLPADKSGHCDFSNCLRPSKIQNSSFLTKINTRSMSPCNFSHLPPILNSSPVPNKHSTKISDNTVKPPDAAGECDFASCLKPSQVQNSLFTAELSEITANKNTNSGSPLTVRVNSPVPIRSGSLDHPKLSQVQRSIFSIEPLEFTANETTNSPVTVSLNRPVPVRSGSITHPSPSPVIVEDNSSQNTAPEPVKHKSEFSITLQTSPKHSGDAENISNALQNNEIVDYPLNCSSEFHGSSDPPGVLEPKVCETVVPPPPPPPPPPSDTTKIVKENCKGLNSMETMIRDEKSNLTAVQVPAELRCKTPKTPVIAELERRLQEQNRNEVLNLDSDDKIDDACPTSSEKDEIPNVGRYESNINGSPSYLNGKHCQNGNISILSQPREHILPVSNGKSENHMHGTKLTFSPNTVITDEPPPPGAVLLDKKVTVDGDMVHTDKFYAIPVKEVLKEKTSTTKFIPAPPKYEGIGPTEDGIPIGLRNSVKKENMHNWYKTMFKSLHKADSSNDTQEYIIGYTSEPETSKKGMTMRKKSSTLDNRLKLDVNSNLNKQNYPPVKSSIEVYNVRPRWIEDYEPGHSSVTDDEIITSRRYLPALNTPKTTYEFKNGYESDTTFTKKRDQPEGLTQEQQKMWYREVQKGGEIPQFGLGKPAPEKLKEPSIGPVPPPPLNYSGQPSHQQAVRPLTLPTDYSNQNGNGYCQQMNGTYEMQMRHAIHSEMQHRRSPSSNQLSPPIRTMVKSPSRSPDVRMPAQALFEFKAESPKEISIKKGDIVLVLRQLDKNWYEGEYKGVIGIFPISYVEIIPPEHTATPVKPRPEGLGRALYDFVAQTSIELTVRKGDTVTLIRRVDANWFEGIFNKKRGIVPISYIQVLQEPAEKSGSSPSPRSYSVSPSSENKEKSSKANSISPSTYSPSSASPLPVSQERRRLQSKKGSNLVEPVMYRALYSYNPQNTDELELLEGDSVYVVEMCDDGWFVGTSVRTGVFGIFPGNYVEKAC